MKKLPVRIRTVKSQQDTDRLRRMSLITMTFAAVLLGLFLLYGIIQQGYDYINTTPQKTAVGELAFACNRGMSNIGVRDSGGCRCLADAAINGGTLAPKRMNELKKYFARLKTAPESFSGEAPSQLEMSREVGLIYGHPFLRAYGRCRQTGLKSSQN